MFPALTIINDSATERNPPILFCSHGCRKEYKKLLQQSEQAYQLSIEPLPITTETCRCGNCSISLED